MTVSSSTARADYNGNGVTTTPFAVPFRFLVNTDLLVLRTVTATGISTPLILDSLGADGFSVVGAGQPSGGTVTVITAPAVGETLTILRSVERTQLTDYIPNDPFPAQSHERALDKLTMIVQEQDEVLTRTFALPAGLPGVSAELPSPLPLAPIVWNATGTAFENGDLNITGDMLLRPNLADDTGGSLVGFKQTGANSRSRTTYDKLLDYKNVFDFMTIAERADVRAETGLVDVTAAVQAAVTACTNVVAPAGVYLVSNTITIPAGHTLIGEGETATEFRRAGSNMSFFVMGTGSELHNIKFRRSGATTATAGRLIDVQVSDVRITDIEADHFYDGIYAKSVAGLSLERIYLDHYQRAGINCDGTINDIFLHDFIITNIGSAVGFGILMNNKCEAFTALNGDLIGGQYGLYTTATSFLPGTGTIPAFCKFTNVFFDSADSGVTLDKSADFRFTSCWFSNRPGNGVTVAQCYDVSFVNCDFVNCGSSGAVLSNSAQKGVQFIGCSFISNNSQNNASNGLTVFAGVSDWSMIGCQANNTIFNTTLQGYGLFVAAGASDRYVISGNNFTGNFIGAVSDGGTGTNKRISANVGYSIPIIAPTLLNSWVNSGGATPPAGYWKDSDGVVHLQGRITGGAAPSIAFTLPAGYRPVNQEDFATIQNGTLGWVYVNAAGSVTVQTGVATVSLAGMNFRAV